MRQVDLNTAEAIHEQRSQQAEEYSHLPMCKKCGRPTNCIDEDGQPLCEPCYLGQ